MAIANFGVSQTFPRFSSLVYPTIVVTSKTDTAVLTAAEVLGGAIIQSKDGATNNTLPSAAALNAAIPAPAVGVSFDFFVRNIGNNTATVVVGTGITSKAGNTLTVATVDTRLFKLVCTGVASPNGTGTDSYDLYSLGVSAH